MTTAGRTRCTGKDCRKLAPKGRKRCDECKPGGTQQAASSSSRPARKLMGCTEPRWFTPPLRPLNRKTSLGFEVADFARITGHPLLPWQEWANIHALELLPDRTFRFRVVLIKVARQQGKSDNKRIVSLWRMYMYPRSRVLGIAQEVALAREQWEMCQETIHETPDLEAEWGGVRRTNGDERFWLANGSRYTVKAASRKAGRGTSNDEVNIDELRTQRDWEAWASVFHTTMARDNSQIWAMSNEGDDESVVLNQLTDSALAGRDPSICMLDWSAPDGCELDDPRAWAQANPGLGYLPGGEAAIRTALATEPPDIFRTEVLCQRVRNLDGAIDLAAWKACADSSGTMDALRDRICAVVDVAPDGNHVTLAVAALLDDGRPRIEIAGAWKNMTEAVPKIPELLDRVQPAWFGWLPSGPGGGMAPMCRSQAAKWNTRLPKARKGEPPGPPADGEIKGAAVAEACQGLAALAKGRMVVHSDDPMLNAQVSGARKLPSGDSWRFTRAGGSAAGHVDGAYAAAAAAQAALILPAPRRARIRLLA